MIVYTNAALMTVPIEIIVKQYKKQLGDRVFPKLNDYVNDFLDYLRDKSHFFRFDINEQTYVLQVFSDLMRGLLWDYRIIMSSEQNNSGKALDESGMKKVVESAVSSTITFVNGIKKRADYHFGKYIENHYLNTFVDLVKKDQNLQWLTDEQTQAVCKKSCELYDTDFDRGGFVGIAIAGYGEEEIYPHLVHLHMGASLTQN